MEKIYISCPDCGRRLARLLGESSQRQTLRTLGGSHVRKSKNAMGEDLFSIRCPKCNKQKFFSPPR